MTLRRLLNSSVTAQMNLNYMLVVEKARTRWEYSSFNWNVYYHQGFTYYAAGLYEKAVEAYLDCIRAADNLESRVATSHWLYMSLIRLGRWGEAKILLGDIKPDMELIEVGDYYETLLMYKGYTRPEKLLEKGAK